MWDGPLGATSKVLRLPWLEAGLLSLSPNGQYGASGLAERTVRFEKPGTEQEVALLDLKAVLAISPEVEFRLAEVSFNPDGDFLLTALWTPAVGNLLVHLRHVGDLLRGGVHGRESGPSSWGRTPGRLVVADGPLTRLRSDVVILV